MKHTKGKWWNTFGLNKERGVRNKGRYICFLSQPAHFPDQDERYERELKEQEANAKLIAAAPELLEDLIEMRNLMQDIIDGQYKPDGFTLQSVNKTIKKAIL